MMSVRRFILGICVTALVLTLAIPGLAASGPKAPNAKGPKVKGKISVEASVTAVNTSASTFTIRVLTPGHRKQVGAATAVILVQRGTDIKGAGDGSPRPASVSDLRTGDRAHVEAFRLDDGRFLALRIQVKNRAIAAPVVPPGQPADAQGVASTSVTGVVTVKSTIGPQFLILNNALAVSVSSDTIVTSGGQRKSYADLRVGQTLTVSGTPITVGGVTIGINARVISF